MNTLNINPFSVIGVLVKTSNQNGQAAKDIPALWGKFMGENIASKIPNVADQNIHAVYTEYEGDHNKPYSVLLGLKVNSLEEIPDGMVGMSFAGGTYRPYNCEGDLSKGIVYNTWGEIWKAEDKRAYTADFEVYDATKPDPSDTAVDIYIGLA